MLAFGAPIFNGKYLIMRLFVIYDDYINKYLRLVSRTLRIGRHRHARVKPFGSRLLLLDPDPPGGPRCSVQLPFVVPIDSRPCHWPPAERSPQ
jgi:hypothetical protein